MIYSQVPSNSLLPLPDTKAEKKFVLHAELRSPHQIAGGRFAVKQSCGVHLGASQHCFCHGKVLKMGHNIAVRASAVFQGLQCIIIGFVLQVVRMKRILGS